MKICITCEKTIKHDQSNSYYPLNELLNLVENIIPNKKEFTCSNTCYNIHLLKHALRHQQLALMETILYPNLFDLDRKTLVEQKIQESEQMLQILKTQIE
ncbi:hypothetical protein A616_16620 [Brevibacillus brevis X23]|nr:hypothetical protein A616_16620 [Brevibacillus brevis X23]